MSNSKMNFVFRSLTDPLVLDHDMKIAKAKLSTLSSKCEGLSVSHDISDICGGARPTGYTRDDWVLVNKFAFNKIVEWLPEDLSHVVDLVEPFNGMQLWSELRNGLGDAPTVMRKYDNYLRSAKLTRRNKWPKLYAFLLRTLNARNNISGLDVASKLSDTQFRQLVMDKIKLLFHLSL